MFIEACSGSQNLSYIDETEALPDIHLKNDGFYNGVFSILSDIVFLRSLYTNKSIELNNQIDSHHQTMLSNATAHMLRWQTFWMLKTDFEIVR